MAVSRVGLTGIMVGLGGLDGESFEDANAASLFRFAGAATGRMDAGAEAAGIHG